MVNLNKFEEKMTKLKNEEDELIKIHDGLLIKQSEMSKEYTPKWNWGFSRKCPCCGKSLKKIKLPSVEKHMYDTYYRNLFVCDCGYKYAHMGMQESGG